MHPLCHTGANDCTKTRPKKRKAPHKESRLPSSIHWTAGFLFWILRLTGTVLALVFIIFQDEHSASAMEMAWEPLLEGAAPGWMRVFLTLECKRLQKMKKQPRMRATALAWLRIEAAITCPLRRRLAPAPFAPARGVTESFGVAA